MASFVRDPIDKAKFYSVNKTMRQISRRDGDYQRVRAIRPKVHPKKRYLLRPDLRNSLCYFCKKGDLYSVRCIVKSLKAQSEDVFEYYIPDAIMSALESPMHVQTELILYLAKENPFLTKYARLEIAAHAAMTQNETIFQRMPSLLREFTDTIVEEAARVHSWSIINLVRGVAQLDPNKGMIGASRGLVNSNSLNTTADEQSEVGRSIDSRDLYPMDMIHYFVGLGGTDYDSALAEAYRGGHRAAIEFFTAKGAHHENRALCAAIRSRDLSLVHLCLSRRNSGASTSLVYGVAEVVAIGDLELADYLFSRGIEHWDIIECAVIEAAEGKSSEPLRTDILMWYFTKEIDHDKKSDGGCNMLWKAATKGKMRVMKWLVENGRDTTYENDIRWEEFEGDTRVIDFVLKRSVNPEITIVKAFAGVIGTQRVKMVRHLWNKGVRCNHLTPSLQKTLDLILAPAN
jgi:hypothetical protein